MSYHAQITREKLTDAHQTIERLAAENSNLQAAKQQAEQRFERLKIDFAHIQETWRVTDAARISAEQKVRALEGALKEIANHKFINYDAAQGGIYEYGQYGIGVVDGHRACAMIARSALEAQLQSATADKEGAKG